MTSKIVCGVSKSKMLKATLANSLEGSAHLGVITLTAMKIISSNIPKVDKEILVCKIHYICGFLSHTGHISFISGRWSRRNYYELLTYLPK